MQCVPDVAPRDRARVAAADAGDARGRRGAAGAAGAVSGARSKVDAVDLGRSVRAGGNGSLCAIHGIHRALAAAIGGGGFRKYEPAEYVDFSRRLLERVAIDDYAA